MYSVYTHTPIIQKIGKQKKQKDFNFDILKWILKYLFLIYARRKVKGLPLQDKDTTYTDYFLYQNQKLQLEIGWEKGNKETYYY